MRRVPRTVLCLLVLAVVTACGNTSAPSRAASSAAVWTPPVTLASELRPQVAFIGDSYLGGSDMGGRGERNVARLWAEQMGWYASSVDGVGGSGYLQGADYEGGDRRFGAPSRTARLDATLDLVFVVNGFNDFKSPEAATEPAAFDTYTAIRRAAPKARVVAIGYLPLRSETAGTARRNALLASAARRAGITFWNPMGTGWLTGPHSHWIGTDRYHLTDAGHVHLAQALTAHSRASGLDALRHHTPLQDRAPVLG